VRTWYSLRIVVFCVALFAASCSNTGKEQTSKPECALPNVPTKGQDQVLVVVLEGIDRQLFLFADKCSSRMDIVHFRFGAYEKFEEFLEKIPEDEIGKKTGVLDARVRSAETTIGPDKVAVTLVDDVKGIYPLGE